MLRRPRALLLAAVVVLVGFLGPGSVAVPVTTSAGAGPYSGIQPQVPDPYFPLDGNDGFAVQTYDVRVRYRFSDGRLSGTAKILVFPHQSMQTFTLDLLLDVDSVSIVRTAGGEPVEAEFRKINQHEVLITPDRPLVNGDPDEVIVKYHGHPGRIAWQGEPNWLADRHEVVTMNPTHMAPWWFPTNEHPSDPGNFDIRITTAKRKEVISNGSLVSRTVRGRTATTHWRLDNSIAPHLAFFAAGDFDIVRGRSRSGFTYHYAVSQRLGDKTRAASMATLRKSARIAAWMRREVGAEGYPSVTGGVVTSLRPGFSVANVTRPTYPANPSVRTVVRQLAREWFGGRVRISQWADIWLNEGFATYLEWRYREAHGGPRTNRVLHRLYREHRDEPRFWDLEMTDPGPARIYDRRVALRGAMTLAALRNLFGPARFRRALDYWVEYRSGRHSSTEAFEAYAPKTSYLFDVPMTEEHFREFFDAWLRGDRPPPHRARFGL